MALIGKQNQRDTESKRVEIPEQETLSTNVNDINSLANENPADNPVEIVPKSDVSGLSYEEITDPNQIIATVTDKTTPVVILFGPAACGKTMTLVRMSRWLSQNGFSVDPDRNFRPSEDVHYKELCDNFNPMINSDDAAESTNRISFMLVKVRDARGKTICQILEAPGEYYYDPKNPDADFPLYVHTIKNSKNRKFWCFMLEPNWKNVSDRRGYVNKINNIVTGPNFKAKDRAIFLFNKIDLTPFIPGGNFNKTDAKKEIKDLYPGIFSKLTKDGIFFSSENYDFIPFSSGSYPGGRFVEGDDDFPHRFWRIIKKLCNG